MPHGSTGNRASLPDLRDLNENWTSQAARKRRISRIHICSPIINVPRASRCSNDDNARLQWSFTDICWDSNARSLQDEGKWQSWIDFGREWVRQRSPVLLRFRDLRCYINRNINTCVHASWTWTSNDEGDVRASRLATETWSEWFEWSRSKTACTKRNPRCLSLSLSLSLSRHFQPSCLLE
jgi:hypothetical protein